MHHAAAPSLQQNGNLAPFLKAAHQYPNLEADEEYALIRDWQEHQDPKALDKLVRSHLKLVTKMAYGYRGYGLALADLVAEGHVGIMQAARKSETGKGFRFSTYAMWWIKASMQEYILNSWSMVKIATTNNQRKLFYNLRRLLNNGESGLSTERVQEIATDQNVSLETVEQMSSRLHAGDVSLHQTVNAEDATEWQDWLVDESQNQEATLAHQDELNKRLDSLKDALCCLNEREYIIFDARRLRDKPLTLEELSTLFDLSRERIRQIEAEAFVKLQKEMQRLVKINPPRTHHYLYWLGALETWRYTA